MDTKKFIQAPSHFIERLGATEITSRSILTPTKGFLRDFTHTINPYVGCWFNCTYCYVPNGFELRHGTWGRLNWGRWVHIKVNAPQVLEKTLAKWSIRGELENKIIYLGSVTDPYQLPWERKYQLTRKLLKIFVKYPVGFLNIQTRSPLIQRDLDILQDLNSRLDGDLAACMTIPTNDDHVKRIFEPSSPALSHRRAALERIHEIGVESQASVSPLLPCNPKELARQLDPICDRIVIGSLIELDEFYKQSKVQRVNCRQNNEKQVVGARTRSFFEGIAKKNGFSWFFKPLEQTRVIHQLKKYLGKNKVLIGQYGFNISANIRKRAKNTRKKGNFANLTEFL